MQFLKTQDAETITLLLQTRVFPLYTMVLPSPYVLATSNWLLGKLATCLPEVRYSTSDYFELGLLFNMRRVRSLCFFYQWAAIFAFGPFS
jgi:hypothetical protein